ncbi:MAG: DUF4352 domain-containing protein [Firmicutes bacterium]|nr:DUF4352 domain-containing protein [Bacillota bacterium]
MKKILALLLSFLLVFGLLTACTKDGGSEPAQPDETPAEQDGTEEGGVFDGRIGQEIETYFFNFTVNQAYLCEDYHGYTPQDGKVLLVVDIDVENTTNSSIPMSDLDFQAQWNDEADDAFSWPITSDPETGDDRGTVSEKQLPYEYELAIGEKRNGELVYEVPEGEKDFSISTIDDFADETQEGDVYFVYFTAGYM